MLQPSSDALTQSINLSNKIVNSKEKLHRLISNIFFRERKKLIKPNTMSA